MNAFDSLADDLERALLRLDKDESARIIRRAVQQGKPIEVAGDLIVQVLERIGSGWEEGDVALSQVYMSGLICEELVDQVLPPQSPQRIDQPKIGIGVFEDYHQLGKRIVYSSLRSSGYELVDLGKGLKSNTLLELVDQQQIRILLLSVLMFPSAMKIKTISGLMKERGVKVVVGGAPFRFDEELWKEVGADAFGKNAAEAQQIVNQMMEEMS